MGVANTDAAVRLSATILSQTPPQGHVAFLTQSGALGASLIDFAGELDVGFSVVVSLGNMGILAQIPPAIQSGREFAGNLSPVPVSFDIPSVRW